MKARRSEFSVRIPRKALREEIPLTPLYEDIMTSDYTTLTIECFNVLKGAKIFREFKREMNRLKGAIEKLDPSESASVKVELYDYLRKLAISTENYLVGCYAVLELRGAGRREDLHKIVENAKSSEVRKFAKVHIEIMDAQRKGEGSKVRDKVGTTIGNVLEGIDLLDQLAEKIESGEFTTYEFARVVAERSNRWLIGYGISILQEMNEVDILRLLELGRIAREKSPVPKYLELMARIALDELY